jgi:hypothetical protein
MLAAINGTPEQSFKRFFEISGLLKFNTNVLNQRLSGLGL